MFAIYGNPWLQALLGLKASDGPPRPHPGIEHANEMTLEESKAEVRDQYLTLSLDTRAAIDAIPTLLKGHDQAGGEMLEAIERVVTAAEALDEECERRMEEIRRLFTPSVTSLAGRRRRKAS